MDNLNRMRIVANNSEKSTTMLAIAFVKITELERIFPLNSAFAGGSAIAKLNQYVNIGEFNRTFMKSTRRV
ncbi:MAG: hypothetical protein SAJ12_04010 [Jaaginema sp. PMC 1079.18]|nr:hypothetical protein [Jaaginema sp. PMC 1080.18]MEC4850153.1 hypothetical protein [Jaaginema sp. PMC 1079.18]MEC4866060.1 hypothetical protein [Jaaginema sp. PMC 1078.18]